MSIKIPIANTNNVISRNVVKQMASSGFLPVIALEAFVEGGRTYQAYKRGGFDEARERITEEFSGAVFWLGGVTGLNWLFEKLGQKLLKLPKKKVDIASDMVRKPLENYLGKEVRKDGTVISRSMMAKFKFAKVMASVLIANGFIGFVLPKINQAITRSYHKNKPENNNPDLFIPEPKIDDILTSKENDNKKDISFNGGIDLLSIADKFENNRNCKLLAVDVGTAGGRMFSARNDDERVEIGFRDISSIYFYMFNMPNMNKWLNQIEQKGIGTRLDPVSAEFTTQYMKEYINDKNSAKIKTGNFEEKHLGVSIEEFKKEFLGQNVDIPKSLEDKFVVEEVKVNKFEQFINKVKNFFGIKSKSREPMKIIELDKFKAELKNIVSADKLREYELLADKMSELQPKILDTSILTNSQVKDILNGGHVNNPEFLKEFYKNIHGSKFLDKYSYVSQKEMDEMKSDLINYVKSIIKKAEKSGAKEITNEMLTKASKHNLIMNSINWGTGFVISAAFLSTFIPKIQYLITKARTGSNEFPGTAQFREDEQYKKAS